MSYYIYDSEGYIGDLSSNNGLNELKSAIGNKSPFDGLWDNGNIEITDEILEAVSNLPDSDKTIKGFKVLVKKCKDIVIITDGVFEDSEKSVGKGLTPDQKRIHWEAYAKKTERQEEVFKRVFDAHLTEQKNQIIEQLTKGGQLDESIFNDEKVARKFEPAIELVYHDAFESAV